MKRILLITIISISSYRGYGYAKDTFEVYFAFNNARMSKGSQDRIDQLIFKDTLIHGDKLIVLGYADYVGGSGYNDSLSRMRAKNVQNYLISSGFNKNDIKLCIGKGKIDRKNINEPDGYAPDRKVQIIIDRTEPPRVIPPPAPPVKQKIDITKLKVNQAFALNNICFQPGLDFLLPASVPDLKNLLAFMQENTTVRIRIEGHICCLKVDDGTDTPYKDGYLSHYRALAVSDYLIQNGIAAARIATIGLGTQNPVVVHEVTEEDRVKNRRVEIRITGK